MVIARLTQTQVPPNSWMTSKDLAMRVAVESTVDASATKLASRSATERVGCGWIGGPIALLAHRKTTGGPNVRGTSPASAIYGSDRDPEDPRRRRCLEHSRSRTRFAGVYGRQQVAKPQRDLPGTAQDRRVPDTQMESGARLPAHQGAVGIHGQSYRGPVRVRMPRRFGKLVPRLRQRELGIRRERPHASATRQHQ